MAYTHPTDARTLYVDRDWSRLVPEESPEAAYVLVGPGGTISDTLAARFQLGTPSAPEASDEPKQAAGPAENKATAPKANKRIK